MNSHDKWVIQEEIERESIAKNMRKMMKESNTTKQDNSDIGRIVNAYNSSGLSQPYILGEKEVVLETPDGPKKFKDVFFVDSNGPFVKTNYNYNRETLMEKTPVVLTKNISVLSENYKDTAQEFNLTRAKVANIIIDMSATMDLSPYSKN